MLKSSLAPYRISSILKALRGLYAYSKGDAKRHPVSVAGMYTGRKTKLSLERHFNNTAKYRSGYLFAERNNDGCHVSPLYLTVGKCKL